GVFVTTSATTNVNLTRLDGNQGVNYRVRMGNTGFVPVAVTNPVDTPTTNAGPVIKIATPALTGNSLLDTVYQGFIYAVSNNILYVSKDFGNNWTHVELATRIDKLPGNGTGLLLHGTNDDVYVPATTNTYGNTPFPFIDSIAIDPQNPNIIYLQYTGPKPLVNPTNVLRVDITNLQDPYDLVEGYSQRNDGGTILADS